MQLQRTQKREVAVFVGVVIFISVGSARDLQFEASLALVVSLFFVGGREDTFIFFLSPSAPK